jgi:hypothetical protein
MIALAWAALVLAATIAVVIRDREHAWWLDELAALEVEAHERAIPVAVAGFSAQRKHLGSDGCEMHDGIAFTSDGFTLLTDAGSITVAPRRPILLIAATARVDDGNVTLPGGTELLLYRPIRLPRRSTRRYPWIAYRTAFLADEDYVLLADRGVRFFGYGVHDERLSLVRLGLLLFAAIHAGLRAAAGSLPYRVIVALGLLALSVDAARDFGVTWRAVQRRLPPRARQAALERARSRRINR